MKTHQDRQSKKFVHQKYLRIGGALIFGFITQFAIAMIIVESLYPNYSVSSNPISDLGVGTTGPLFNTSIALAGGAVIVASYVLFKVLRSKPFLALVGLAGLGALLVGIFNESFGEIHGIAADLTFIAGSISAIYSFRFVRPPMNYFAIVLGLFSLGAISVSVAGSTLGLGNGGIERMIVYPFMLWGIGFGGYLLGNPSENQNPN